MANSKKALDENGVLYLWGKVKTYVTMCTPLTPPRWTRWRARA